MDNEAHRSSGRYDVDLSTLGIKQSEELGERYKDGCFAAIFCSDLLRSYKTAEITFGKKFPIIKDSRLRECDYGDFTRKPSAIVDKQKVKRIVTAFPNGESYKMCAQRMKKFIEDVLKIYDGRKIMVIGHRATQYGIEHWIKGIPIKEIITTPWSWQPGWIYKFGSLTKTKITGAKPFK